ncbi:hypothetical protein AMAG_17608 [Allomyces macrogynus ATCC 38327]|uniref:Uncharacterized protein n=1 Tax=Allomyces macrogynus (strain ATCC 38327) TaxID=578462 RepID=A0A0L0RUU1_ALLM3|nr:hypothetical protein AMAG_17608 [Allomyces macrogynus ATCC 38327]|eukprot:KNE54023.1 hypothetical protein AMAG_17608 [Allomyces macrogynus ATCC 38327]
MFAGDALADTASGAPDPLPSNPPGYMVIPDDETIAALIVISWIVLDERKCHGAHHRSNESCDSKRASTTRIKRRGWFAPPRLTSKSDGRLELLLTSAIFIFIEATNALGFMLFTSFPVVPIWPVYYTIRTLVFVPVAGMSLLVITLRVSALCFKSLAIQERLWSLSIMTVAVVTPCTIVGNLLSAPHVDWSRNSAEDFGTDWSSQLLLLINAVFPVAAGAMTVCSVHAALIPLIWASGGERSQSWWKWRRGSRQQPASPQQPMICATAASATTLHDHTVDKNANSNASVGVPMSPGTTRVLSLSVNTTRVSSSLSASTACASVSASSGLAVSPAFPPSAVPVPVVAPPARSRPAHQIQSHLGFTFWLLTAAYLAGWAVLFLYHSLATTNLFLGMSISTSVTACCLIVESLFKLIVKARVARRADGANVMARSKRSSTKLAGPNATDSADHADSITSMGQLAVSSWPTLATFTAARPDGGHRGNKVKSVPNATSLGGLHALAEDDEIDARVGEMEVAAGEMLVDDSPPLAALQDAPGRHPSPTFVQSRPSLRSLQGAITIPPNETLLTRIFIVTSWVLSLLAFALVISVVVSSTSKSITSRSLLSRPSPRRTKSKRGDAAADTRAAQFFRRRSRCFGDSDGRLELLLLAAICIVGETTNALFTVLRAPFPAVSIWPEYYTARSILFFPVGGLSLLIITLRVSSLCFKSQSVRDRMWYAATAAVVLLTPPFIAGNMLLAPATDWNTSMSLQSRWWSVLLYVNAIFPVAALIMTAYSVRVALGCSTVHTGSTAATGAVSSTTDAVSTPLTTSPATARGSTTLQVPDAAPPPVRGVSRSRSIVSSLRVSATRRTTPSGTSNDKSIQTALGKTFGLLTAGYLVIWAAQLAYNTLATQNTFLRMAVTTSFTTCWLVVETLFKMIVRARVRNRRRAGPTAAAVARHKGSSGGGGEVRRASIGSMGQLDLGSVGELETPQVEKTIRPSGSSGQRLNEH